MEEEEEATVRYSRYPFRTDRASDSRGYCTVCLGDSVAVRIVVLRENAMVAADPVRRVCEDDL
jgi:hypothetical protein